MTIVSNSQIMDFQTCEKRFYYAHVAQLKPKRFPDAVERGIFGHDLAKAFFTAMMEGKSYEDCSKAVTEVLLTKIGDTELTKAYRLLLAFGAYAFEQDWMVVETENSRFFELPSGNIFAYKPDIVLEWTKGPKKGTRLALDFKFTGQYWTEKELNVYQQLPKYMIYYNKVHDKKIVNCGVVMLNTRASSDATGSNLFMLKWLLLNKHKLERIEEENETMVNRVAEAVQTRGAEDYMRTVNTFTCKLCFFNDQLCSMNLEGRDTSRVEARLYEHNTYFEEAYGGQETS